MSTQPPNTQANTQPVPPRYPNPHAASPSPTGTVPPETSTSSHPPNPPTNADTYYWQHWPEVQSEFLQQRLSDAIEQSEKFAKQLDQQVKFFRAGFSVLAVVFTAFFTFLQVRQVFLEGRENRRTIRQDSWELINSVVSSDKETSAGLTFAIRNLTQQCQSLSGLELRNRFLPEIQFIPPSENSLGTGLEQMGGLLFGVSPDRYCADQKSKKDYQLDLRAINLERSKLFGARFNDADLQGASFQDTELDGAVFEEVNLQGSNFQAAQLDGATFSSDVRLAGANFARATFPEVDFKKVDLHNVKLCEFDPNPKSSPPVDPTSLSAEQYRQYCADLSDAKGLKWQAIQTAQHWQYALYDSATCKRFKTQGMTEETAPVSCQVAKSQSAARSSAESNVL